LNVRSLAVVAPPLQIGRRQGFESNTPELSGHGARLVGDARLAGAGLLPGAGGLVQHRRGVVVVGGLGRPRVEADADLQRTDGRRDRVALQRFLDGKRGEHASSTSVNVKRNPSPVDFTLWPPARRQRSITRLSCGAFTVVRYASSRRPAVSAVISPFSRVESTMSVNMAVTIPPGSG
jgi:hypothetical protein